jgi:hypothetical protein
VLRILLPQYDLRAFQARQAWQFALALGVVLLLTVVIGRCMVGSNPGPQVVAWLIYGAGIVAILSEPRYGLYLIVFFSLAGDMLMIPWYPFNKNFSSSESLLFINSSMKFSALELYLALVTLSWALRQFARRKLIFKAGSVGIPVALFMAALVYGLVYGIFVRHGDMTIALWESRAMLYLPVFYFLAVNLIEDRQQINNLMWAIMLANIVQAFTGVWYYFFAPGGSTKGSDGIMEHSASIHLDALFVYVVALFLFGGPKLKRTVLALFCLPALWAYLVNQRRASFVSLGLALILLGAALFRQNRRVFWMIAPPIAAFTLVFMAATWNNSGTLGLPARGIKSALGMDINSRDESSNVYRVIENVNTNFTIHQAVLTGIGFGNKFFIIAPMPDISFFTWWEYITHNSIMWVWMKTGVFGFLSMLLMAGSIVAMGARSYDRLPGGDYKAIGATMLLYIIMHFVYAYVDMSWENQSMIFVGAAAGILGCLDTVMARRPARRAPRYRWLRPLPADIVIEEEL